MDLLVWGKKKFSNGFFIMQRNMHVTDRSIRNVLHLSSDRNPRWYPTTGIQSRELGASSSITVMDIRTSVRDRFMPVLSMSVISAAAAGLVLVGGLPAWSAEVHSSVSQNGNASKIEVRPWPWVCECKNIQDRTSACTGLCDHALHCAGVPFRDKSQVA